MARQGDQSATENLFRRYHDRIFSYLIRIIGERSLAEDATQEAFIRGFRALKHYQEQGSFKSWIFQIAHREGLRMLKKERQGQHGILALHGENGEFHKDEIADSSPLPTELLMHQEQLQRLEKALDQLNDREKQVVLLRMHEGRPFKEISQMTGTPLNTVLGRMHNGVRKLKKELNRREE